jgi:putative DNA primase/helicase
MTKENDDFIAATKFLLLNENNHNLHFVFNSKIGLYRYDNGIYINDYKEDWIKKFISDIRTNIKVPTLNEIVEEIKIDSYKDFEEFDAKHNIVSLINCNYNLETDKIEEFDPNIISTSRIPIKYDPTVDCPVVKSYLKSVVDPLDIPVVEELFGFLLSKRYEHKYMFVLHGGKDSGKSTLLQLIETFLDNKVSHIPPHILAKDKFAAAELFGKRANISGDISAKMLEDTNLIKMLIGSDGLHADKKFGEIFTFTNFAKLIFACNKLPAIPDNDLDIFVEKMKIISIPHTIPKEEQDHTLLGRMTTPEELSGLFNLALEGRKRLKINNDFSNPLAKKQMMDKYFATVDPVVKFVREVVEISVTDVTIKDDILESFKNYCKMTKIKYPEATLTFWKTFKSSLPKDIIDYNRRVGKAGNQKYAVGGIRLRNLSEIETLENTTIEEPKEIKLPIIDESKISTEPTKEIDYGYDEPMPQPDPEPPLTAAEIAQLNEAFAEIKKREAEADKLEEEYEKHAEGQ